MATYGCASYNCGELLEHEVITGCPTSGRLGGISHIIAFSCDNTLTDNEPDGTAINTEVTNGTAVCILAIKAGIPEPTPIEAEATTSCSTPGIATYDRTLTIEDFNVSVDNNVAWDSLFSGQTIGALLLIECDTDGLPALATFIGSEVKFRGGRTIPNVNTELQKYVSTASWRSLSEPHLYAAPTGITCLG